MESHPGIGRVKVCGAYRATYSATVGSHVLSQVLWNFDTSTACSMNAWQQNIGICSNSIKPHYFTCNTLWPCPYSTFPFSNSCRYSRRWEVGGSRTLTWRRSNHQFGIVLARSSVAGHCPIYGVCGAQPDNNTCGSRGGGGLVS